MQFVFQQLLPQFRRLEIGLNIGDMQDYRNVKLFLLLAAFDKPARASALNIVNSTGFYGCLKCRQKGVSIKTQSILTIFFIF